MSRYHDAICQERQASGQCPLQKVFVDHALPVPKRPRAPMTYQNRLFVSILFAILMLLAVVTVGLIVTSCQDAKYPNVLDTMPSIGTK